MKQRNNEEEKTENNTDETQINKHTRKIIKEPIETETKKKVALPVETRNRKNNSEKITSSPPTISTRLRTRQKN